MFFAAGATQKNTTHSSTVGVHYKKPNMAKFILIVMFLFQTLVSIGQTKSIELIGSYYSVNNKFERWSIIRLLEKQNFEYEYGVGGCQGKVTGKWTVERNFLKLVNDPKFNLNKKLENDTILLIDDSIKFSLPKPIYPNLGLTRWKIGNDWIKPVKSINTGCFKEKGKHKKE